MFYQIQTSGHLLLLFVLSAIVQKVSSTDCWSDIYQKSYTCQWDEYCCGAISCCYALDTKFYTRWYFWLGVIGAILFLVLFSMFLYYVCIWRREKILETRNENINNNTDLQLDTEFELKDLEDDSTLTMTTETQEPISNSTLPFDPTTTTTTLSSGRPQHKHRRHSKRRSRHLSSEGAAAAFPIETVAVDLPDDDEAPPPYTPYPSNPGGRQSSYPLDTMSTFGRHRPVLICHVPRLDPRANIQSDEYGFVGAESDNNIPKNEPEQGACADPKQIAIV